MKFDLGLCAGGEVPCEKVYYTNVLSDYLNADTERHQLGEAGFLHHFSHAQHRLPLGGGVIVKCYTFIVTGSGAGRVDEMEEVSRHLALRWFSGSAAGVLKTGPDVSQPPAAVVLAGDGLLMHGGRIRSASNVKSGCISMWTLIFNLWPSPEAHAASSRRNKTALPTIYLTGAPTWQAPDPPLGRMY